MRATPSHDTRGNAIHAHGGGIFFARGKSFWVGETEKLADDTLHGVACYSSLDLMNWQPEGVVLSNSEVRGLAGEPSRPGGWVIERPKVLFNARTNLFVMWFHLDNHYSYTMNAAGVATCDTPCGRYQFQHALRPGGMRSLDASLYLDSHLGYAYRVADIEHKAVVILRLRSDFLNSTGPPISILPAPREAPCLFRWQRHYYLITSGIKWWDPNPSEVHVASSLHGPWKLMDDPFAAAPASKAAISYDTQPTYVLMYTTTQQQQVAMYMSDQWCPRNDSTCTDPWCPCLLGASYRWMPVRWSGAEANGMSPPRLSIERDLMWRPPLPDLQRSDRTLPAMRVRTPLPPLPPYPPQPPPPPPSPPPLPAKCGRWCNTHTRPWATKCAWDGGACASCKPCRTV